LVLFDRKFYRTGMILFDEAPDLRGVDILRYLQRSTPVPNATCEPFSTLEIDLSSPEDVLLAGVRKDTRYEIRRAQDKDGVTARWLGVPAPHLLYRFTEAYDRFAEQKHVDLSDRRLLSGYARAGVLELSTAAQANGRELVWHAYLVTKDRARLLHSASGFRDTEDKDLRALAGRANRLLHWRDMLALKARHIPWYDLGGWQAHSDDPEKARISQFKESFGGRPATHYNCVTWGTLRGRALLRMEKELHRAERLQGRARQLIHR
jgi:hypothetical protein